MAVMVRGRPGWGSWGGLRPTGCSGTRYAVIARSAVWRVIGLRRIIVLSAVVTLAGLVSGAGLAQAAPVGGKPAGRHGIVQAVPRSSKPGGSVSVSGGRARLPAHGAPPVAL